MGCRLPGKVTNPDEFWEMLLEGKDTITEIPKDRWSIEKNYDPELNKIGKTRAKWGGFIEDIDKFDANFFGISPREASLLDPQQRLILEVTHEAMEDAGLVMEKLKGSQTGVFIGAFTLDWKLLQFSERNRLNIDSHSATGSMMTLISNRISYSFDLKGPSMSIDTACSSSLVALHLACQSIWQNESTMAIAGGVNVMIKPEYFIAESKAGMLSPTGHSKTYDNSADGYVRGEGAAVVILKPLSQAIDDNDYIHSVIRATGCNQDGQTSSITIPNGEAQEQLMRNVYEKAGIAPSEIQYVEAHGTGTPVGDPIEANAIGRVFSQGRSDEQKCYIGSVKTNIGHLEAAAGVAGLIKAIQCVKHGTIPKHLHVNEVNPNILFEELKLQIPIEATPWPETNGPRRAAINSFGFGGTNAHVIIEQYQPTKLSKEVRKLMDKSEQPKKILLPLSAKSDQALKAYIKDVRNRLETGNENETLSQVAYSIGRRRNHYLSRTAFVAQTKADLIKQMDGFLSNEEFPTLLNLGMNLKPVFVFTGMGPQWWGMGQELYHNEPVFKRVVSEVDGIFKEKSGWSILEQMLKGESDSQMEETKISQPANFALQIGLLELWKSKGVYPAAVIGHSAGEAASAYASGMLSLEAAVEVIYARSRLQQLTSGEGRMMAVGLSEKDVLPYIKKYSQSISIAAINSPNSVTLVGDEISLKKVEQDLTVNETFCKYLQVKVPYHSHYMEIIKQELLESLKCLNVNQPTIPIYSTVTGEKCEEADFNSLYWWRNVREPVRFAKGCFEMLNDGYQAFLEIGPHSVLGSSIKECMTEYGVEGFTLASLRRNDQEIKFMESALVDFYTQGGLVDFEKLYPMDNLFKFPLYPWQKEKHWIEMGEAEIDFLPSNANPILGQRINSPQYIWENEFNLNVLSFIEDHQISGTVVFPGAGYVDMALSAVKKIYGEECHLSVKNIEFKKALFLNKETNILMRLEYNRDNGQFHIFSRPIQRKEIFQWEEHAAGYVVPMIEQNVKSLQLDYLKESICDAIAKEKCYLHFENLGLEYGTTFQGIEQLWRSSDESLARIVVNEQFIDQLPKFTTHPAILDLCFQVMAAALPFNEDSKVYMPIEVGNGNVYRPIETEMYVYAKITENRDSYVLGDIYLLDESGNIILEIKDCKAVSLNSESETANRPQKLYQMNWIEKEFLELTEIEKEGVWLVFADVQGFGHRLAEVLKRSGHKVKIAGYTPMDLPVDYLIDPKDSNAYKDILLKSKCENIVHTWSLDIVSTDELTIEGLIHAEALGVNSALLLLQAVYQEEVPSLGQNALWFITRGTQQINELDQTVEVGQSSLWGMARVIGHQEFHHIFGGIIDLSLSDMGEEILVFKELMGKQKDNQIAIRQNKRFVARLELSENESYSEKMFPLSFNADATYLITGGLGALGVETVRWMIQHGARRFILMGRSPLPERKLWKDINTFEKPYSRVQTIRELEQLGAMIHIAAVDISSEEEVRAYLDKFEEEGWPEIRGVIHSAGVANPQLMMDMNIDEFNQVLHPKIFGAWNLHQYFKNRPLEFFVLYSSVASLIVSPGQSNYSAGNAFLDALSHYRKLLDKPSLTVNWGPWGDIGMATQLDLNKFFIERGLYPMSTNEGLRALQKAFSQNKPQVAVVGADWKRVIEYNYPVGVQPSFLESLCSQIDDTESNSGDNAGTLIEQMEALLNREDQIELLSGYLTKMAAAVLRIEQGKINQTQPLTSWGLDSMMAIELKNIMEKECQVSVAVVELLKGINISNLSKMLYEKMEERFLVTKDEELSELFRELEEYSEGDLETVLHSISGDD